MTQQIKVIIVMMNLTTNRYLGYAVTATAMILMMQTPVGMDSGLHRGRQCSARQQSSSDNTLCICQSVLSATHSINITQSYDYISQAPGHSSSTEVTLFW